MYGYVAIALLAAVAFIEGAPPVRVTIDCGASERAFYGKSKYRSKASDLHSRFDVNSFCNFIHGAIPKAINNGRFVLREPDIDQSGLSDTQVPVAASPPYDFVPNLSIPRFKVPKLNIPKINVPKLKIQSDKPFSAPRVGSAMPFTSLKKAVEEESSAERMEKFKKGVQKMLHVVKVLGQIDQYLSERTRIVIDKLAKTFAD